jgi:flagellar biogenesis protein FliO
MAEKSNFTTKKLLMLLAVIALIVGLVFLIIYLVSDRNQDTNQDLYNRTQAQLWLLLSIALATVSCCWEGWSLCATI